MKSRRLLIFIFMLVGTTVVAQEKQGELTLGQLEPLNQVVRSPERAVLYVISEVAGLEFESTRRIFEVRPRGASEWHIFVEPGRQILTIRCAGYKPIETGVIFLAAKRAYQLDVTQLRPIPGTLIVRTNPDSANLRIDGAPIGTKTPFTNDEALPGDYYVQIDKPGYRAVGKMLNVESSKATTWEVELVQTAVRVQINLENELDEVGILIDDEAVGVAPGFIFLEPGSYRLMLQKEKYIYTGKVIDIVLGEEEIVLTEKLEKLRKPFFTKWWFLTGTAAAITGSAFLFLGSSSPPDSPLPEAPDFPSGN